MPFPRHPRPVGQRRAVPEMTVRYQQPQAIAAGHVLTVVRSGDATTAAGGPAGDGDAASGPGTPPRVGRGPPD